MPLSRNEQIARAMTRVERAAYLAARGWERLSPGSLWIDPQTGNRFALGAAVRVALDDENPPTDAPTERAQVELDWAWAVTYGRPFRESPVVCDGCHATVERIAERGHFGSCDRRGRHLHPRHIAIADCIEWRLYLEDLATEAALLDSSTASPRKNAR